LDLINNTYEAINLYFEDEKVLITHENIKFVIDFKQIFLYYKVINSKFLADKIGMNPSLLSQYVQVCKRPSDAQTEKILMRIHLIAQELSEISLIYK